MDLLSPSEILQEIPEITRDELSYYVRMDYITPTKVQRGKLRYNDFSKENLKLLKHAHHYISRYQIFPRDAFKRAQKEIEQGIPMMDFFIEQPAPERSLRILLQEPRPTEVLETTVNSQIKVIATVAAINMIDCSVSIEYEQHLLCISEGSAIIQLGAGTFIKDIFWTLTTLPNESKNEQTESFVTIKATAGDFFQVAQFKMLLSPEV